MKKYLMPILLCSFLLLLSGCGASDKAETIEGEKVLQQTIDQLSKINSYELTISKEQTSAMYDKIVTSKKKTNQKVVFEPFVHWSRTDSTSTRIYEEGQDRTLSEAYQVLKGDQLDMFMRFSSDEEVPTGREPVLGEWNKVTTSNKEQADWVKDAVRSNLEAQLYLLSTNIESFKLVESSGNPVLSRFFRKFDFLPFGCRSLADKIYIIILILYDLHRVKMFHVEVAFRSPLSARYMP